jgi:ubiquinone biosynthesis protein
MGDAENAALYLTSLAEAGPRSDPTAFRRDVEDISRQWAHRASFAEYSLGKLILQSIARAGRYRMYFPVEMVLMVKAIVTFEGVGNILLPGFDVAEVSRRHLNRIILQRFSPLRLGRETVTGLPELVDALAKTPRLITEGLHLVEQATRKPAENPFAGLRATLFGGACLVAGAILAGFGGPWPVWVLLLAVGILLPLRRGQ